MSKLIVKGADDDLVKEIEFELQFYSYIAGTNKFEVLPIPLMDGSYLTAEEKASIIAECGHKKISLVYRVSHGKYATVFCPNTNRVGIVPEDDPRGFPC